MTVSEITGSSGRFAKADSISETVCDGEHTRLGANQSSREAVRVGLKLRLG